MNNSNKIKSYQKNELLKNIIKELFPNDSFAEKKTLVDSIKNIFSLSRTNKKNIKIIKDNITYEITLFPHLSSNYNITDEMSIEINKKNIKSRTSGKVYKKIKIVNKNIDNIIFKEIINDKEEKEFKSLIFHFLLQEYYKRNNFKKLIHLCNLFEFGYFKNTNGEQKLYAIMENCGLDLLYYKKNNKNKNKKKYEILLEILKILYQCCKSLELIHELKYLHLDIKLENFMINNNIIKIIDFGNFKNLEYKVIDLFGTPEYLPNDWIDNYYNSKHTILKYHHDIFSLGCMFIIMICIHIFELKKKFMVCPFIEIENEKKEILYNRLKYNIKDLEKMIDDIKEILKEKLKENNNKNNNKNNKIIDLIIKLIPKLVNPDPIKRYQSVKEITKDLLEFKNFELNIEKNEKEEIKKIEIPKRINNN